MMKAPTAEGLPEHWRQLTLRRCLGGAEPQSQPEAILVAGQPAAGKSVLVEELCRFYARQGHCAVIDAEELALLLPADASASDRHAAGRLVRELEDELLAAAIGQRAHLIISSRLNDLATASGQLHQLHVAGYFVGVAALCVDEETSWQSLVARSERYQQLGLPHQELSREQHHAARETYIQVLRELERERLIDELYLLTRAGHLLAKASPRRAPSSFIEKHLPLTQLEAPQTVAPAANPLTVELAGGKRLKLGTFAAAGTGSAAAQPAAETKESQPPHAPADVAARRIKLGQFQTPATPQMPAEEPATPAQPAARTPPPPAPPAVGIVPGDRASPDRHFPSSAGPVDINFEPEGISRSRPAAGNGDALPPPSTSELREPPAIDWASLTAAEQREIARKQALQSKIRKRAGLE